MSASFSVPIPTTLLRDRSDRLVALAAIAALLLAGCGGGSEADATSAPQVAAAPAPAAPANSTPTPSPSPTPSPTPAPAPAPAPVSAPAAPAPTTPPAPTPAPTPTSPAPTPAPTPAPAPAPTPAPAPAPSANTADITCGLANFQADALRLINARRAAGASCGSRGSFPATAALSWNTPLTNAAYGHSRDMATQNYFSHTSADGRTLGTRVTAAGYAWQSVGENIAAGYGTVQQVVDGWMASDGHCANLMGASFVHMGMACARQSGSTYGTYWTLDLGRPR